MDKQLNAIFYGMVIVDHILFLDQLPKRSEICLASKESICLGGSATNSATCISHWGIKVGLAGFHYLGKDFYGDFFIEDVHKYKNIDTQWVTVENEVATHSTIILVDSSGERTIIARPCPQKYLSLDENYLKKTQLLSIDGKYCHSEQVVKEAAVLAHKNKIPIILSDTPPESEIFALADIVINSVPTSDNSNIEILQKQLREQYQNCSPKVIVTLGAKGCVLIDNNSCSYFPVTIDKNIIDTTGAGDIFRSGLIYGYINCWEIERAIRLAIFVASKSCQQLGGSVKNRPLLWLKEFRNESQSLL